MFGSSAANCFIAFSTSLLKYLLLRATVPKIKRQTRIILSGFFCQMHTHISHHCLQVTVIIFTFSIITFPLMPKKCIYLIAILQAGKSLVYTHVYLLNERKQQGVSSIRSWLSLCQPFRRRRPKTSLGSIIIRCYGSSANSPFHHIKFLLQQLLQPIICHCIKSPHIIFFRYVWHEARKE